MVKISNLGAADLSQCFKKIHKTNIIFKKQTFSLDFVFAITILNYIIFCYNSNVIYAQFCILY